jgi:hypothetical protein
MAIKQFAIPLDSSSHQSGDRNFKELSDDGSSAEFELSNVGAGATTNSLNLVTKKRGVIKDHVFSVTVSSGIAKVTVSHNDLSNAYADAAGGDWDYVEARWTVGQVDTPDKSNQYMIQNGRSYDLTKWPPD